MNSVLKNSSSVNTSQSEPLPEDFLQRLLTTLPMVAYRVMRRPDGEMHIAHLSEDVSRKFFGVDSDQSSSLVIHPDDLPSLMESIERSVQDQNRFVWRGRLVGRMGQSRWLQATSVPSIQADGTVYWDGILSDFSDQARSEREIEAARFETLEKARLDSMDQISGNVAHELNTPLCTAQLLVEQLLKPSFEKVRSPSELNGKLAQLQQTIRRIIQIVGAFRSAIQGGSSSGHSPIPVRIAETIESTMLISGERLTRLGITVNRDYDRSSRLSFIGRSSKLMQILTHLLQNAQEALANSPQKSVTLSLIREGEKAVIRISDSGAGIDSSARSRIFQPYFSTKKEGGHGVGLALARHSALKDGWVLDVESYANPTTFRLEIPLSQECLALNSK